MFVHLLKVFERIFFFFLKTKHGNKDILIMKYNYLRVEDTFSIVSAEQFQMPACHKWKFYYILNILKMDT